MVAQTLSQQRQRSRSRRRHAPATLQAGCTVSLHGLKGAAELNGLTGVLDAFVQDTGRWRVKLHSGDLKDLRPENLKPADIKTHAVGGDALQANPGDRCGPGGRFIIQDKLGEGTYSTVYRCKDGSVAGMEYAVKFTRGSDQMRKNLERECKLMGIINNQASERDPEGARCLLRLAFFEGFEHAGHFAIAFELMKYDLRVALDRYGKGKGLPMLPTVRDFGKNMFLALRALHRAGLVHCDVKPENLLMSKDNHMVKLCDFGSTLGSERIRTDQLQPRHYRAPEIILGQDYGAPIDVWSAGATLFELATDVVLFKAHDNNGMLHEFLKVCGAFPRPLVRSGKYARKHFNETGDFISSAANFCAVPMASFIEPQRRIDTLLERVLQEPPKGVPMARHEGLVRYLVDLLSKCLVPEQSGRETAEGAVAHRFFQKGA